MRPLQSLAFVLVLFSTSSAGSQAIAAELQCNPSVQSGPIVRPLNGFVENKGQWPDEVLFLARDRGIDLTVLPDALVLRPVPDRETGEWPAPLVLRLPHGAVVTGEGALPTQHNFLLGSIRASRAQGFERVVFHDVTPGLDIVVRLGTKGFEYDLDVAAGADLSALVLELEGASGLIAEDGALLMQTAAGPVEQRIGAAWQVEASGAHTPVASRFRVQAAQSGDMHFGFEAPGRDAARPFVLDPSLVFATYVGGGGQEQLADMAVDGPGATYLTCRTQGPTPTTPGAFQPLVGGSVDAWIGKLAPDGASLLWGTFLGGSSSEVPIGVDVDVDETVVVAGQTWSANFPTTPNTVQPFPQGVLAHPSFFVTRLTADGTSLVWSTYFGGPESKELKASALFSSGDVLLAGEFDTGNPAPTPGVFDANFNPGDQFLAHISADGAQLVWMTCFKASSVADVTFDDESNVYFCGQVFSNDAPLPATAGVLKGQFNPGTSPEGYVAKLDPTGAQLLWATYLGGDEGGDSAIALAVDAARAVYVAGLTDSSDFPTTAEAYASAVSEPGDGFVAKLLPNASQLVWSTYLGATGPGTTVLFDVAVDTAGNPVVVGNSNVPGFPVTPDALQSTFKGPTPSGDCHLTKLDAFGEKLVYSTWFGGHSDDSLVFVDLDAAQQPYLACRSTSTDIQTTAGAYDGSYGGSSDMVVAQFSMPLAPWKVMGGGLKGTADIASLAGAGSLTAGSTTRVSLRGGKPSSPAYLVSGLSAINAPFKGGTLVPAPDVLLPIGLSLLGSFDLTFAWPSVPSGIDITLQVWIQDAGAVHGWSASNTLQLTAQ